MSIAWFICPYKRAPPADDPLPVRYCAMDDLTPEIMASDGDWSEFETDRQATPYGQTIVRLRAPNSVIRSARGMFRELSETEARSAWSPTVARPFDDGGVFGFNDSKQRVVAPFDTLVRRVPDERPSREVLGLFGLWSGLGFGEGWRLPQELCAWLATHGMEPSDWLNILARILFDQRGAFGDTGVIDNFNRSNEDPVSDGGKWTCPVISGDANAKVVSNQLANSSGGGGEYGGGYRSDQTYGPVHESFTTMATWPTGTGENLFVFAALQSPGTTNLDGYALKTRLKAATDEVELHYITDNAWTILGAKFTQEQSANDKCGLDVTARSGTEIGAYWDTGGGWSQLATRSDTQYTTGYIGLEAEREVWRADDFGGGTVSAGGLGIPLAMHHYQHQLD